MVDEEEDIARGNEKGAERREREEGMDEGGGGGERRRCAVCVSHSTYNLLIASTSLSYLAFLPSTSSCPSRCHLNKTNVF